MSTLKRNILLFIRGGISYCILETLWRGFTHWSMLITGGVCLTLLYNAFTAYRELPLLTKCVLGSIIITAVELVVGCIVNLWLGLNVWDYSRIPLNFYGQICVLYSTLWGFLCIPIVYITNRINDRITPKSLKNSVSG